MRHSARNPSEYDPLGMNQQQKQAVYSSGGPVLVLAGAGSGKTRVVTHRIIHLLEQGIPPQTILGVTFTNKASEEMRSRIRSLSHQEVWISTFHKLGARILRTWADRLGYTSRFAVYDEEDSENLLKICLKERDLAANEASVSFFRRAISSAKNRLITPQEFVVEEGERVEQTLLIPEIYAQYQEKMRLCGAVDFDDLLYLPVQLWKNCPEVLGAARQQWRYLLIDEYQDTNEAQYQLARLLVHPHNEIFAVGDPDQAIYSWRGANLNNILNFERDYPGASVVRLEQNYRSVSSILNAANHLIQRNRGRLHKDLWSMLGEGERAKVFRAWDERAEARFVASKIQQHNRANTALREMAVLYRTHAQSRLLEEVCLAEKIPYKIIGGISFYQRKEIKDLLAFLRVIHSDRDEVAFLRTVHVSRSGAGEATLKKILLQAKTLAISPLELIERWSTKQVSPPARTPKKALDNLIRYAALMRRLQNLCAQNMAISDLITELLRAFSYAEILKQEEPNAEERLENIDALITKSIEWESSAEDPSLTLFLEELALQSSLDSGSNEEDALQLMTVHHGKGLEFEVAFVVGLEEGLFPHINALAESQIEEERRLCYVAITRAKKTLYFTYADVRTLWGTTQSRRKSRFLAEIPFESLDHVTQTHSSVDRLPKVGQRVFHKVQGFGIVREHCPPAICVVTFDQEGNRERVLVQELLSL